MSATAINIGAEERRADTRRRASADAADLASARARDRQSHTEAPADLPDLAGILEMARELGHAEPTGVDRARLELQWALANRRGGARERIDGGEILRRAAHAASRVWLPLSDAERDSLMSEVVKRTLARLGPAPESRQVSIGRLEREAVKLAQRAKDRATRADADADSRSWRDVADRDTLRLDHPAPDAEPGAEPMGACSAELAREDATFARKMAGAESDARTADALGLKAERVAWVAALNGWTDAQLAQSMGAKVTEGAAKKARQRSAAKLRERCPTPTDLAGAWMAAERAVGASAHEQVRDGAYDAAAIATYRAAADAIGHAQGEAERASWHRSAEPVGATLASVMARKWRSARAARAAGWYPAPAAPIITLRAPDLMEGNGWTARDRTDAERVERSARQRRRNHDSHRGAMARRRKIARWAGWQDGAPLVATDPGRKRRADAALVGVKMSRVLPGARYPRVSPASD